MGKETRRLSYEIAEILGRGGSSIIRRGVSKSNGGKTQVAIKTLKRLEITPPETPTTLLTNKILVMKKIVEDVSSHPNVVHLYDVYEDQNAIHLVLELCSGGEIFDRIVDQEKYSETEAATVIRQIVNGLASLHKANIVHRDLKPENCLFLNESENSPLKITDFGLSSVEDFTDPVVGLFGSIDYVSPEASTKGRISSASDMWSLGGEFNFDEPTWKTISSPAKQLISSLLTVDPHKRATAQEVIITLLHPWVMGESAKQENMGTEIISRLHSLNARRKLRAAAIDSMCGSALLVRTKQLRTLLGNHNLTFEELEKLIMHFRNICANGENATLSEFEDVLKAMEMPKLLPLAPRIFDLFDNNHDGTVDIREIFCGFSSLKSSQGENALHSMYDTDRSGCITKEEVTSMMRALPEECLPPDITEPSKLDEIFDRIDINSDGKISFEEFKAAMKLDSSLQDAVMSSLRPA
uniref:Calcium and calcium/calmodulin-dependent serine/threonine-protein kinase-like n=1 Tax=Nelumbo nucifera TaxID=4432 RepID=A0A822ZDL4_NELNU|nr:TPA_asm: hypothetical protein HUJ06_001442 [Nelumbo nucifera]